MSFLFIEYRAPLLQSHIYQVIDKRGPVKPKLHIIKSRTVLDWLLVSVVTPFGELLQDAACAHLSFNDLVSVIMSRVRHRFLDYAGGMASRPNVVHLSNGVPMPLLGLGTSHGGGYNQNAVVYAIRDCGYRHIDTAKRYGCEQYICDAIDQSGVPREEMFLASKMWPRDYGFLSGKSALSKSLDNLGTDYLDLYMMHWPLCPSNCANPKETLLETWRALEVSLDEGRCKAIGVSNFYISDLETILENCSVVPHVDQCEFHPFQNPAELRVFCRENRIQFEGYCPLAKGAILNEKPVTEISRITGRTPAQVLIRWAVQNQVVTIPKSTKESRVWENCQVFDFQLSDEHMAILNNLHSNLRAVNPDEVQAKIDDNKPDGYKLFLTNPRASLPRETEQA